MLAKITRNHLVADIAHVWLFLVLRVLLHVVEEFIEGRKSLVAYRAVRRMILRMRPQMRSEIVLLVEALFTESAL
jgi:hypothetical protein